MRAARRTIVFYILVACTCAVLITCSNAQKDDDSEDIEEEQQSTKKRPQELPRKLWDCVEDNNTLTCFNEVFYNEFNSKVMYNPNVENLKKFIYKHLGEYLKMKRVENSPSSDGFELINYRQDNGTDPGDDDDDGDDGHRGMKEKMMDFLPYLLAPALLMAGIMPWVIPPLKMMVMFVAMINNMAFSSALFSLVRNYVFNRRPDEHVFYINHGYQNQKHR